MIKRKELCHIFEGVNSNVNGDPNNDNRPRMDEETGYQYVSQFRPKRTIRDYIRLLYVLNREETNQILYRKEFDENRKLKDLNNLLKSEANSDLNEVLAKFIDVRLFGGLVGNKQKVQELEGPVQFSWGKSYHKVKEMEVGLSTVMPSSGKEDAEQGSLAKQFITPYSLIGVDATVNEFNGLRTTVTEEDIDLMLKALWDGTNNLKTTSKNQKSLFLALVEYKEGKLKYIGELKSYFKLVSQLDDLEIRSTKDYFIEVNDFVEKINSLSTDIERVIIKKDNSLTLKFNGEDFDWTEVLNVPVEEEIV